jgi:hypothetical protein
MGDMGVRGTHVPAAGPATKAVPVAKTAKPKKTKGKKPKGKGGQ